MPIAREPIHMFETASGDELDEQDLRGATWKVVETYVDYDDSDESVEGIVFTHRVEVHSMDDLTIAEYYRTHPDETPPDN
jgi:hypothetical protein